ncbi:MAG TPA: hypothetical protein VGQ16_05145 [Vicinamibacterales bacterium]|nr:hypothetical protein [Vicinamibacterales bacterium]
MMIASFVSFLATAMSAAYAVDRIGLTISPLAVLVVSIAAAAAVFTALKPTAHVERVETFAFAAIVSAVLAYLLWLARPALLPVGGGPDLAHHLMLVDYIERHWRLAHDPALGAVMGEMVDYTPGLHVLAVLAGAWTRTDGFHAVYPLVALTVAVKAGLVFAIAMRVSRHSSDARGAPPPLARMTFAIAAVLLLLVPREYFFRSFTEHSFLAQVVAECFAIAMWWAVVVWTERPTLPTMVMFAIAGVATFLTWPVWIGPLLLLLLVVVASQTEVPLRDRVRALIVGIAPIALVASVHALGRVRAAAIAGTSGFVVWPSVDLFGWWFLALALGGVILAAADRRARSIVWLLAAIALQAAALFVVATRSGADRPYLALKMVYLAIYPLAVAASLFLGRMGRSLSCPSCLLIVAALAIVVARPLIKERPPKPVVSEPMFLAGQWARANLPPACIDYLVRNNYTAYWLHLAVLGNARQTERTRDNATFDSKQALVRWIQPEGLPFAIADDFDALPKDIRTSVDVIERFGPAAVVRRRGPSSCEENRGAVAYGKSRIPNATVPTP